MIVRRRWASVKQSKEHRMSCAQIGEPGQRRQREDRQWKEEVEQELRELDDDY